METIHSNLVCGFQECNSCIHLTDSVFSKMEKTALDKLNKGKRIIRLKRGEWINSSSKLSGGIYCIFKGKAKVVKMGFGEQEQIIGFGLPGDILSFHTLHSEASDRESAVAMTEMYLCFFSNEVFKTALKENWNLTTEYIARLYKSLLLREDLILVLTQKQLRERIATLLMVLLDKFGYKEDCKTLNLEVSRNELATFAGTTIESISRKLRDFKDEGIIATKKSSIIILDREKLKKVGTRYD